jgi:O-acetylhomoserine/O-acetylserine sulfhydrylase-like pyridoxal-dependent enzyme
MRKALVIALLVLPLAASADVIYDSLKIADQQLYDSGNGNWIGGMQVFGSNNDLQLADDFTIAFLVLDSKVEFR